MSVTARDIFSFSWHYWRRSKGLFALFVIGMMANVGFQNVLMPKYIGLIVDTVQQHAHDIAGATPWLTHYFILFTLSSLLATILWSFTMIVWNEISAKTLHNIVNDALFKVQRFSSDWHANSFAGGTVRKITRGMWSFDLFADTVFTGFFLIILVMFFTLFTLMTHVPMVGWFLLCFVIVYFGLSLLASVKILVPYYRRAAGSDTAVGATLADIMTGIPTIKAFASEDREDELFSGVTREWYRNALRSWQMSRYIDAVRSVMRTLLLAGMVGITLYQWSRGLATTGDLALVITCYFNINSFLRDMGMMINDIQKAISEMEDVVSFWKQDADVLDAPNATTLRINHQSGGQIVFDHVQFAYKNTRQPVYADLSVIINPGEKVALVGMSGSGKSTFVKLLQRLYDIQGGAINIDGQNIASVTQKSLRANIALVPQDPILFHRSLAENIAYARPDATRADIENAAKLAFAHDFIMSFPQGYDTLVGERGVKLSGGERQRVAVARAILANTPILVLDEATSSLDSVSEHYIQKGLEHLMEGRTTITIAHRLATIRAVDRILVFAAGQIVEQGSHDDLLAQPDSLYKRLYDMQALGLIDPEHGKA